MLGTEAISWLFSRFEDAGVFLPVSFVQPAQVACCMRGERLFSGRFVDFHLQRKAVTLVRSTRCMEQLSRRSLVSFYLLLASVFLSARV